MYKNIIFDLGGVLVHFDPQQFLLDRFCNAEVEKKVYELTFGSEEWQLLDAGKLTRRQGNAQMLEKANACGYGFEVQCVLDDWMRSLHTKKHTAEILLRLHNMGFHLYYLSNIAEDTFKLIRKRDFFSLFDGGLASYQLHVNKPDSRIFDALMYKYNLSYDETIFIDDNRKNAEAACALYITGIHYQGASSLIRSLNSCGIQLKEHFLL